MIEKAIVVTQSHNLYTVCLMERHGSLLSARVAGRLLHRWHASADYPAVGDHVLLEWDGHSDRGVICDLLPRRSHISRAEPITGKQQIIAANVDVMILCMSLNQNYSVARAQRYLSAAYAGGVEPVIILTKADLCIDAQAQHTAAQGSFPGVCVLLNDAKTMQAAAHVRQMLAEGKTLVFTGSSGVGKSTLANAILGTEAMHTAAVREGDGRGRHTTTHREMLFPECGGAIIDTPGMRAFALDEADVDAAFTDLAGLAEQCRFSDCTHTSEPGCAVRQALARGEISQRQLDNYLRLKREESRRAKLRKRTARR